MAKGYFSLAVQNLRHRGLRSWLTMIGIFIGIAAVVSLISLGDGLRTAVTGQFTTLSTDKLVVQSVEAGFGPPGSTAIKKLTDHDLNLLKSIPGVDFTIPRLIRTVRVDYNKVAGFKYIASMPEDQGKIDYIYKSFNMKIESGRELKLSDKGKIVIGSDFDANDEFGKKINVGSKVNIAGKDFEVIGRLQKSSTFTINLAAIMLQDDMKQTLNISDEIDMIVVKVSNPDKMDEVANAIKVKMRKDRNEKEGKEDFTVQTPEQALNSVNTILNIINVIITGIAAISLFIGGIGIANTMYTSVLERMREIGIMKAVGAENKNVLKIFIYEAGLLGSVGGIIGAAVGLIFAFTVSGIANAVFGESLFVVKFSLPLILSSILFSFLIGVISGILPAIQASKLRPVDALRGK